MRGARLHLSGASIADEEAFMSALWEVLIWRCVRHVGVDCENAIVECLDHAFGGQVRSGQVLKSQLLNCYHQIFGTLGGASSAFKSHSSTRCRGRPRSSCECTYSCWTKLAMTWVREKRRFGCLDGLIASRQEELDFLQKGYGSEERSAKEC